MIDDFLTSSVNRLTQHDPFIIISLINLTRTRDDTIHCHLQALRKKCVHCSSPPRSEYLAPPNFLFKLEFKLRPKFHLGPNFLGAQLIVIRVVNLTEKFFVIKIRRNQSIINFLNQHLDPMIFIEHQIQKHQGNDMLLSIHNHLCGVAVTLKFK